MRKFPIEVCSLNAGNLNLFPCATHLVGFDVYVPPAGEWLDHGWREGIPFEISPDIEVVPTPGHTDADITLMVRQAVLVVHPSPNSATWPHSQKLTSFGTLILFISAFLLLSRLEVFAFFAGSFRGDLCIKMQGGRLQFLLGTFFPRTSMQTRRGP